MRINPDGIDLSWFAVDRDGHVGFFTSAGSRIVPEVVLKSRETWESLKKAIHSLPRTGKGSLRFSEGGNLKDWIEMAARGLFAYDFKSYDTAVFENGDYQIIATPSQPLVIASLGEAVGQALSVVTMKTICFAKENLVQKDLVIAL
jgi:hypothetical protein